MKLPMGLQGQFFLYMLLAVRTLLCITSQVKNLLLCSEQDFQMSGEGKDTKDPMNWHSYADATENFLSAVHF
jgi:hypothetical protein